MTKNIVIFSDGTGQEGGIRVEQRLSNIYKMYRVCRVGPETSIDPHDQVAFYDPGLGTETTAVALQLMVRMLRFRSGLPVNFENWAARILNLTAIASA